jgi:hypothetical protein
MAEKRDELMEHYRMMRRELLAAIDGLDDAQLVEPSIDGWSVKDHLAHIAFWDHVRAQEVERISAGYDSTWKVSPEHEAVVSPIFYEMHRNVSLEQARWELGRSHQALLAAIAATNERGRDPSQYGEAALLSRHEAAHTGWIRRWRDERGR